MRYLVTGGAGFIGSHLVEGLLARGDAAVVLDDLSTGRRENLASVGGQPGLSVVEGSVLDEDRVARAMEGCAGVFHLAAAVGVRLIVEDPVRTIETNIHGTEVVLRQAARRGAAVLLASTSEVYGKGVRPRFREDDDMLIGPTAKSRWSYAASKAIDEFLALAWHRSRGLPVVIARLFNTVGPRQVGRYGMVIPRFIEQARRGGPITVYGDGTQSRCFCHVRDVVAALLALVDAPAARGQVFNVGSEEEVTIGDLAARVAALCGAGARIERVPYEAAWEAGFEDIQRRAPDTSRIRALLGWRPTRTLDDILRELAGSA